MVSSKPVCEDIQTVLLGTPNMFATGKLSLVSAVSSLYEYSTLPLWSLYGTSDVSPLSDKLGVTEKSTVMPLHSTSSVEAEKVYPVARGGMNELLLIN